VSYSATIRSKDGKHELVHVSGDIPDGDHVISGHEGGDRVDLSVIRKRASGATVASAMHSHVKEERHHG
jgi:hypothetical protein